MNLINIMTDKEGLPSNAITMGGSLGLWNMVNNKIVTLPVYVIYEKQAKDKDLLKFIKDRISTVRKQIEELQKFFKSHGFDAPNEPNWEKKLNSDSFVLSGSILDDEEIALIMKEHIKSVLSLETEALRNATVPESRNLIFDMIKHGHEDYGKLIQLMKDKKWAHDPPILVQ